MWVRDDVELVVDWWVGRVAEGGAVPLVRLFSGEGWRRPWPTFTIRMWATFITVRVLWGEVYADQ